MTDNMSANLQGNGRYFCPPSWLGLIKQLVHLTQFSGGLQVLDGERGSGKTVIAQQLASTLGEEVCLGVLALPAGLPTAQVFDCLLTALGVDVNEGQSVGESIVTLRRVDAGLKVEQLRKVLIIDDAHNFDDQALAALVSVFQGNSETEVGLSLVFIAEPGLAQRLDTLNLVDIEIRDSVIPAFSLQEAKSLVASDFALAYPERDFPFSDDFIVALWGESDGKPGDILKIAQAAYAQEDAPEGVLWHQRIPIWHLLALILLLGALILGYFSADESDSQSPLVSTQVLLTPDEADLLLSQANTSSLSRENTIESPIDVISPTESAVDSVSAFSSSSATGSVEALESKPVPDSVGPLVQIKSQLAITPNPALKSSPPKTPNTTVKPEIAPIPATAELANDRAVRSMSASSMPVPNNLSKDEAFLMSRPQQGFVLQVLAANSQKSLEEFVARQSNRNNLHIYRSIRSGKSWFVVVEGFYADKGSALAAINNLPKGQLKAGPWPKSIAAVKLEITAFKQQTP